VALGAKSAVVVDHGRVTIDVGIAILLEGPRWLAVRVPIALFRSAREAARRPIAVGVTGVLTPIVAGVVSRLAGRVTGSI
jgi:hypothetical protein